MSAMLGGVVADRHADFAVQCDQIDPIELILIVAILCLFQQIGVVVTQVDAGDRPQRTQAGNAAGEAVCRDAYTHAALDYGFQEPAFELPVWQ